MNKNEMEAHHVEYNRLSEEVRKAQARGLYGDAIKLAKDSWSHIDGMLQYARRHLKVEISSIDTIEVVLKYAPLLFDKSSLDEIGTLLKECRTVEKNTSENMGEKLSNARDLMWNAHRLWNHIEHHSCVYQNTLRDTLGGDQDQWRRMVELWEKMGLLRRQRTGTSCQLSLATRFGELVTGKCQFCGELAEAPKAMFLEKVTCTQCSQHVLFVILDKKGIEPQRN